MLESVSWGGLEDVMENGVLVILGLHPCCHHSCPSLGIQLLWLLVVRQVGAQLVCRRY